MEPNKYSRLNYKEKVIIQALLNEGKTKIFVAKELNRTRSAITREINKWVSEYDTELAHWNAKD